MSEREYPTEDQPIEENNERASNVSSHQPDNEGSDNGSKKAAEGSPTKEKHEDKGYKTSPGVLIFVICTIIAFALCLAGMTLGMFDSRENDSCISIWGYKPKCTGSWFRHMDFQDFLGSGEECKKADSLVQGAQAFSVMCIIGGFLTSAVGILEVLNYAELAVVAGIMSCINTVATLVTWSTMTAMYWSNLCGLIVYADTYKFGKGLILFVTAWCLQMVASLALVVDIYLGNVK